MLFGVYLTYLLLFALTPFTPRIDRSELFFCQVRNAFEGLEGFSLVTHWDVWTNIALFVPFGFLFPALPLVTTRPFVTKLLMGTLAAGLTSGGIEVLQVLLPRHPSITDIILNTLGAFVGGLSYRVYGQCRASQQPSQNASKRGTWALLPLLSYLLGLGIVFGVPFPLGKDFHEWASEFDLYLGSQEAAGNSWSGEVYLLSVYHRVLHESEVSANFSAGPYRESRIEEGQLLRYDFLPTVHTYGIGVDGSALPIHLEIKDRSRIEWLMPNGLAIRDTTLSLFSRPVSRPYGGRFSAHRRFSVEAWIASPDGQDWGSMRLVSYSANPDPGLFPLAEWKHEVALSFEPPPEGATGVVAVTEGTNRLSGTVLRHLVVTYEDGLTTSYVNGIEVGRKWQRFKNAVIDRFVNLVGWPFAWPLYSVLIFPLGYLGFRASTSQRASVYMRWEVWVAPVLCLIVLQGIRCLTLNAPIEIALLLVGSGTLLVSIVIAPLLAPDLIPR